MKKTSIFVISVLVAALNSGLVYASFPDVLETNSFYTAINYVQESGIVSGYPDGTYKPDNFVNRAEFVKILVGSALDYNPSQDPSGYDIYSLIGIDLTDINSGDWFVPYVRKALENNIIEGYPDGTFGGIKNINKAEAAKIIVNSFDIEILDESFNTNWFDRYIFALEQVNAVPLSLVCPDQKVTRGELAEMIYRVKTGLTTLPSTNSYTKTATKLEDKSIGCGSTTTTTTTTAEVKTVTLDDSDTQNGSTMYDFDTEQRTNMDVDIDMMLSGMFYEDEWMRGVDWQVVPMDGTFDSINQCPADGYASVYDEDGDGFGNPYNAWQGDVYCLKTSDANYVLLEVLSSYNKGDNRFLTFKYIIKKTGSTKIR